MVTLESNIAMFWKYSLSLDIDGVVKNWPWNYYITSHNLAQSLVEWFAAAVTSVGQLKDIGAKKYFTSHKYVLLICKVLTI